MTESNNTSPHYRLHFVQKNERLGKTADKQVLYVQVSSEDGKSGSNALIALAHQIQKRLINADDDLHVADKVQLSGDGDRAEFKVYMDPIEFNLFSSETLQKDQSRISGDDLYSARDLIERETGIQSRSVQELLKMPQKTNGHTKERC